MSAHYYDAGSGPHDAGSAVNEHGHRNCGCRHDGRHWVSWCDAAKAAWESIHLDAAAVHAARWIES